MYIIQKSFVKTRHRCHVCQNVWSKMNNKSYFCSRTWFSSNGHRKEKAKKTTRSMKWSTFPYKDVLYMIFRVDSQIFFRPKDIVTLTSKIKSEWRKWAMKHWLLHTITSLFQSLNWRIIWLCRVLTLLQTWALLALIAWMHNRIKTIDTSREQISLSVSEQWSFVP